MERVVNAAIAGESGAFLGLRRTAPDRYSSIGWLGLSRLDIALDRRRLMAIITNDLTCEQGRLDAVSDGLLAEEVEL